jgi:hypothetical protein
VRRRRCPPAARAPRQARGSGHVCTQAAASAGSKKSSPSIGHRRGPNLVGKPPLLGVAGHTVTAPRPHGQACSVVTTLPLSRPAKKHRLQFPFVRPLSSSDRIRLGVVGVSTD